jgi:excisionase family DNA binding protein
MSKSNPIGSYPPSILDDPSLLSSRVITVNEACAILRMGVTKMYDLLNAKVIRSYKDGTQRRIFLVSVLEYQKQLAGKAA